MHFLSAGSAFGFCLRVSRPRAHATHRALSTHMHGNIMRSHARQNIYLHSTHSHYESTESPRSERVPRKCVRSAHGRL